MPSGNTETSGPIWQKPWQPLLERRTSPSPASGRSSRMTLRPAVAISTLKRSKTFMAPLAMQPVPAQIITRRNWARGKPLWFAGSIETRGSVSGMVFLHRRLAGRGRSAFLGNNLVHQRQGSFRIHAAVHLLVDDHHRSETTGAQAGDGFHREEHVRGGFFLVVGAELLLQCVEDRQRMLHVAGRTVAHADDVLALGLQSEVRIERRYAKNPGGRNIEGSAYVGEHFLGEILVFVLDCLQDRNEPCRTVRVAFEDAAHLFEL